MPSVLEREIYAYMGELGEIEGHDRDTFESCDYEHKKVAVLGDNKLYEKAKVVVDEISELFNASIRQRCGKLGKLGRPSEIALIGTKFHPRQSSGCVVNGWSNNCDMQTMTIIPPIPSPLRIRREHPALTDLTWGGG